MDQLFDRQPLSSVVWRTALVAGLAVNAAACAKTFDGGGFVAAECVQYDATLRLENGESIKLGVGDLSVSNAGLDDELTITNENAQLTIDYPNDENDDSNDERAVLTPNGDSSLAINGIEENGHRLTINVDRGDDDSLTLVLEKTCAAEE